MKKIFLFLSIFIFTFCSDDNSENDITDPEIEWISGGTTTTFTYSSGVLSGYTFYRKFDAIESGEVTIKVQVKEDDKASTSGIFTIEKGNQYSISIRANKSGSQLSSPGANCLTVVFSSPSCLSTEEIAVSSYLVPSYNEYLTDQYYCPISLLFGEIEL